MENSNFEEILKQLPTDVIEQYLSKKKVDEQRQEQEKRASYEHLRQETIVSLCTGALDLQKLIIDFKRKALNEMDSFYELLQEYSARHKDGKGNFTLDYDIYRIKYRNRVIMKFDERAIEAKKHIIDFIDKRWEGDEETRRLIKTLLDDKSTGELNARDVNRLYTMENSFEDENWRTGIKLLKESYKESETKSYIQFSQKDNNGEYKTIVLNFPTLVV